MPHLKAFYGFWWEVVSHTLWELFFIKWIAKNICILYGICLFWQAAFSTFSLYIKAAMDYNIHKNKGRACSKNTSPTYFYISWSIQTRISLKWLFLGILWFIELHRRQPYEILFTKICFKNCTFKVEEFC